MGFFEQGLDLYQKIQETKLKYGWVELNLKFHFRFSNCQNGHFGRNWKWEFSP